MGKYGYDNMDLPTELSEEYIERKWRTLQSDTNMLNKWWTALEARFHTRQQISFIEAQRRKLETAERFATAKANTYRAGKDARDAETDFNVSGRKDYQDSRARREILGVDADIADLEARIADAKRRQEKPKTENGGPAKEKARRTAEEVRAGKEKWFREQIKDKFSELKSKDAARKMLDLMQQQEFDEIDGDETLTAEEKEKQKYSAKVKYANMRDEIDKMTF